MAKKLESNFKVGAGKKTGSGVLGIKEFKPTKTDASAVQKSSGSFKDRLKKDLGKGDEKGRFKMSGNPKGKQVSDTNAKGRDYQKFEGMFGHSAIACANVKGKVKGKGSDGRDLNCGH